jgi:hypothetical protein
MNTKIKQLTELINQSNNTVFFGGGFHRERNPRLPLGIGVIFGTRGLRLSAGNVALSHVFPTTA